MEIVAVCFEERMDYKHTMSNIQSFFSLAW